MDSYCLKTINYEGLKRLLVYQADALYIPNYSATNLKKIFLLLTHKMIEKKTSSFRKKCFFILFLHKQYDLQRVILAGSFVLIC